MQIYSNGIIDKDGYHELSTRLELAHVRQFGEAVYTTLLASRISAKQCSIAHLERHLQRLTNDFEKWFCSKPNLSIEHLHNVIEAIVVKCFQSSKQIREVCIRVFYSRRQVELMLSSYSGFSSDPLHPYISLFPVVAQRSNPSLKLSGDTVAHSARKQAVDEGFSEALLLSSDLMVLEGAWSNFFWIDKNRQLYTSVNGILPGITRSLIVEQFKCVEIRRSLDAVLENSIEAFITQGTAGVVGVSRVGESILPEVSNSMVPEIAHWYKEKSRQRVLEL